MLDKKSPTKETPRFDWKKEDLGGLSKKKLIEIVLDNQSAAIVAFEKLEDLTNKFAIVFPFVDF